MTTKKAIVTKLEQLEKIEGFRTLKQLNDFLNVYCYEQYNSIKEMKKNLHGYIFKYNHLYYYCYYDGIAYYMNNELYKKYKLLDLYCISWVYDKNDMNYVIIDDMYKEPIKEDDNGLQYVNYNGLDCYLMQFESIEENIKGCTL